LLLDHASISEPGHDEDIKCAFDQEEDVDQDHDGQNDDVKPAVGSFDFGSVPVDVGVGKLPLVRNQDAGFVEYLDFCVQSVCEGLVSDAVVDGCVA